MTRALIFSKYHCHTNKNNILALTFSKALETLKFVKNLPLMSYNAKRYISTDSKGTTLRKSSWAEKVPKVKL